MALDSGTVKYIDGEEEAFKALTQAVKKAKRSLRTTRFARQTIIDNMPCHEEFMNALKIASYKVTKFDRIICINTKEKWLDVLTALGEFCPQTTTIYLRKEQFTIKFELVIIDEEVSFIHFYLPDDPYDTETQNDEKIRSTLKIVGPKISKKLADIFDRLHHRDYNKRQPTELSRTLLGVYENADGSLKEESKEHGFLKINKDRDYYIRRNPREERARVQQYSDAELAIKKIMDWNVTDDEKKALEAAMEQYFSHSVQRS